MGLFNTPATFIAMMKEVLGGYIDNLCTVYLDNTLLFSKTIEERRDRVRKVLGRLRKHKLLHDSPKNCHYMTKEVEFIFVIVSSNGIKVNTEKQR